MERGRERVNRVPHLLPGASWQPVASQAGKKEGPERADPGVARVQRG